MYAINYIAFNSIVYEILFTDLLGVLCRGDLDEGFCVYLCCWRGPL